MQYDLNNLTPFLMKSVEKWGSAGQQNDFQERGSEGVMKNVFLPILMISSAIEIIFMFNDIDLGSVSPFLPLKSQFTVSFFYSFYAVMRIKIYNFFVGSPKSVIN